MGAVPDNAAIAKEKEKSHPGQRLVPYQQEQAEAAANMLQVRTEAVAGEVQGNE